MEKDRKTHKKTQLEIKGEGREPQKPSSGKQKLPTGVKIHPMRARLARRFKSVSQAFAEKLAQKIDSERNCLYNKDNVLETFYQRNQRPLAAVRDFVITLILVSIYYEPKIQTTSVLVIITVQMLLDLVYKPFKEPEMNREHYLIGGCFLVITSLLTLLSWTEETMSQKTKYYLVGYVSIAAIGVLLVYMLLKTILGLIGKIRELCVSGKEEEKKPEQPSERREIIRPTTRFDNQLHERRTKNQQISEKESKSRGERIQKHRRFGRRQGSRLQSPRKKNRFVKHKQSKRRRLNGIGSKEKNKGIM